MQILPNNSFWSLFKNLYLKLVDLNFKFPHFLTASIAKRSTRIIPEIMCTVSPDMVLNAVPPTLLVSAFLRIYSMPNRTTPTKTNVRAAYWSSNVSHCLRKIQENPCFLLQSIPQVLVGNKTRLRFFIHQVQIDHL